MLVAAVFMSAMASLVRIACEDMHPFQVAFLRNVIGVFLFVPILFTTGLSSLKTGNMGLMFLRGVFNAIAMLTYFFALTMIPFAEMFALTFTVPLFVSLMAVLIFREQTGPRRISCLAIGFFGAMVVVRPGFEIVELGAIYALVSALAWAMAVIVIKRLSRDDSPVTITFYGLLFLTIVTFPLALFVWEWPTLEQYILLLILSVVGTVGQLLFTQSLKLSDASLVMPFDFTKLIWASFIGFYVFSEIPTVWTILGGVIIFSSASYLTYREGKKDTTLQPL